MKLKKYMHNEKMITILFLLFFMGASTAHADSCHMGRSSLEDLQSVIESSDRLLDGDDSVLVDAKKFLDRYKNSDDFTEKDALGFESRLQKIATNSNSNLQTRVNAYLYLSGIQGILSRKLQSISLGKAAIASLKRAMALDGSNKDAAKAYAGAITGMIEKGFIKRKLIETSMGFDLSDEAAAAMKALERNNLTSIPEYTVLKNY